MKTIVVLVDISLGSWYHLFDTSKNISSAVNYIPMAPSTLWYGISRFITAKSLAWPNQTVSLIVYSAEDVMLLWDGRADSFDTKVLIDKLKIFEENTQLIADTQTPKLLKAFVKALLLINSKKEKGDSEIIIFDAACYSTYNKEYQRLYRIFSSAGDNIRIHICSLKDKYPIILEVIGNEASNSFLSFPLEILTDGEIPFYQAKSYAICIGDFIMEHYLNETILTERYNTGKELVICDCHSQQVGTIFYCCPCCFYIYCTTKTTSDL